MSQVLVFIFFAGLCQGVSRATLCTSRGRFPSNELTDCRGYTTCLAGGGDVFYQYDLTCPPNFIYNHIDNQCANATGYQCLPEYNCTSVGNVDNPASNNCNSYVACIDGLTGIVTARLVDCPFGTVFSSIEKICVNETSYECPRAVEPPKVYVENVTTTMLPGNIIVNSSVQTTIHFAMLFFVLCLSVL